MGPLTDGESAVRLSPPTCGRCRSGARAQFWPGPVRSLDQRYEVGGQSQGEVEGPNGGARWVEQGSVPREAHQLVDEAEPAVNAGVGLYLDGPGHADGHPQ